MTAAEVRRLRLGRTAIGRLVMVGAVAALVAAGALSGALPARRWEPFFQATTWTFLGEGLLVTLVVGGIALVGSLAISVPLGMARTELRGVPGALVTGWIELVRATPILAILVIVFLGLPRLGLRLEALQAAVIGLIIYNSAVLAEIVRAGIASIPKGEVEAARSLGLGYVPTMRFVVLPQAVARMTPAIVSQLITLIKDTSLAFILGAQELVGYGRSFFNFYGNSMETYVVIAIIFFLICYPLSRLSRRLEARQPATERVVVTGEVDQLASATP
jgi:His/Glu/Gln/Arg/opine family amino acid ABC transporter permease subunit